MCSNTGQTRPVTVVGYSSGWGDGGFVALLILARKAARSQAFSLHNSPAPSYLNGRLICVQQQARPTFWSVVVPA